MHAKNILIVHNQYRFRGGEDTVVENEKKMLEKHGHKVSCYFRSNLELDIMPWYRKFFLPLDVLFSLQTFFEVRETIKKNDIDIIHVHNTLPLVSPSVYYAAWSRGIPVVQTMHNFRFICPGATLYRNRKICKDCINCGLNCAIKHKCYRKSFGQTLLSTMSIKIHRFLGTYRKLNIISLTDFNKRLLLSVNNVFDKEKIYVKPNFTFNEITDKKHMENSYYLFVGRIEEIKGIKMLLKAFAINKKRLIIVGDGELKEKVENYIKKHQLDNVIIQGWLERSELNKIIVNAKALIVPSQWYETFGMTIIEAFSNGVPVVVGEIGNITELVDEKKTGLHFRYNSTKSLNATLDYMDKLSDEEMNSMKKECLDVYYKKYSEEVNYQVLIEIYEKSIITNTI